MTIRSPKKKNPKKKKKKKKTQPQKGQRGERIEGRGKLLETSGKTRRSIQGYSKVVQEAEKPQVHGQDERHTGGKQVSPSLNQIQKGQAHGKKTRSSRGKEDL